MCVESADQMKDPAGKLIKDPVVEMQLNAYQESSRQIQHSLIALLQLVNPFDEKSDYLVNLLLNVVIL